MVGVHSKKYLVLVSLVLATVVFFSGFGLGYSLDKFYTSDLTKLLQEGQLALDSLTVEQQLLFSSANLDAQTCAALKSRLVGLQHKATELAQKIETYETKTVFKANYDAPKKQYIILSTNNFLALTNLKANCGYTTPDTILFFYGPEDDASARQGIVLDALYLQSNGTLITFPYNGAFEQEPLITFLKTRYNVTTLPTLIINDKIKLEGFQTKEELQRALVATH